MQAFLLLVPHGYVESKISLCRPVTFLPDHAFDVLYIVEPAVICYKFFTAFQGGAVIPDGIGEHFVV